MGTGLRKPNPQKSRVTRVSGEQDMTVGSAPKFSQVTVPRITNVESISSHSYTKTETAVRGGFSISKNASNKYVASFDELQIRGNWKINSTSIYTGTEDHDGYTTNAGDMTLYSDGSDASIHAKSFYISSAGVLNATSAVISGQITATSGGIGGWSINSTSIYTGTEDHSGYTGTAGHLTLYSSGSVASIHANKWYIDTAGKAYFNTGDFSGAISSSATITGGTFQTAGSGTARAVLTGSGLELFDSAGTAGSITSGSVAFAFAGLLIDCIKTSGAFGVTNRLACSSDVSCTGNFESDGVLYLGERASALSDKTGVGQLWVKNTAPCELWFTGDTGVDISISAAISALSTTCGGVTAAEMNQVENIDSVTISNTQWGYLGAMNQGVATTSTPTFAAGMTIDMPTNDLRFDDSATSTNALTVTIGASTRYIQLHTSVTW